MFKTLRMGLRLLRPVWVLTRHRALIPPFLPQEAPWFLRTLSARPANAPEAMRSYGARLREALTKLGPTYIKAGQFIATRPDVVGAELAGELGKLQDRLPPFPLAQAKAQIEAALGKQVAEAFDEIGEAVAAASIAQVHKARAGDKWLAVKVLRPGVAETFARDLAAFADAAKWAVWLDPQLERLKPGAVVETLARSVAMELDLRMEAAAGDEMAESFRGAVDFRVPAIDWDRTAQSVMTAEWIDGISLKDRAGLAAAGFDFKAIATLVIQTFLRQALNRGFFHADMHQGNLFLDREGRLVTVDYGIVGRLDASMRRFMAETLHGFLIRDYRRIADIHFAVGFVKPPQTRDDFAQALRAVGEPIFGRPASAMSMANLLTQLLEITRIFGMELQPQLVLLQKTMVVVEGVARELDPGHSIWESAKPVVEEWMTQNLGAEARLRDAAEGLGTLGRAVRNAETVISQLSSEGLRLHADTAIAIAEAQAQRTRHVRVAVWVGAVALAALALMGIA
jgi:ubiquinone biosynthesis protein